MQKFLVPALLLGLVGIAAALGASSSPATAPAGAPECHQAAMKTPASCPMTAGECDKIMDEKACADMAGDHCAAPADKSDCATKCEEKQEVEACKTKKMECGDCPTQNAPVEKP